MEKLNFVTLIWISHSLRWQFLNKEVGVNLLKHVLLQWDLHLPLVQLIDPVLLTLRKETPLGIHFGSWCGMCLEPQVKSKKTVNNQRLSFKWVYDEHQSWVLYPPFMKADKRKLWPAVFWAKTEAQLTSQIPVSNAGSKTMLVMFFFLLCNPSYFRISCNTCYIHLTYL
ncbi:hypothetical protein HanHA300_Chr02g0040811 [Helianthus annuus]|nr:hypothetical protein HanHA300_Chr02g0040811 [Helianthus annuus]KAJ0617636.1 hypothetical protein HanHA89_Chr02g0044031 [Helianthus annuus]KAJ0776175.1 hypothetical protein HanLR1_Chr02g0042591 [Helianthus annuus]